MSISKKAQIIKTGKALFWKYGFKRVTIEEVCSESNVSKMTFYKYFSNKMELVKAILEQVMNESINKYQDIMQSDIPFTEKVEKQIEMKMEGTAEMSAEFMDDLMIHGEPEMMQYMQKASQKTLAIVYQDFLSAQKKGEIRKDIKPEFIIYFLNHMYDMIKDEQLIAMYSSPSDLALELIKFFFYGIAGNIEADSLRKNE